MVEVLEEVVLRGEGVASGCAQARDVPVVELDVPGVVGGEGHADLGLEHLVGALEDVGRPLGHRRVVTQEVLAGIGGTGGRGAWHR